MHAHLATMASFQEPISSGTIQIPEDGTVGLIDGQEYDACPQVVGNMATPVGGPFTCIESNRQRVIIGPGGFTAAADSTQLPPTGP